MAAAILSFPSGRPWSVRQHPRKRTSALGFLDTALRDAPAACIVRDLSLHGAKVVPSSSVAAEDVRFLTVPGLGIEMQIRLVWINAVELGFVVNRLD